MAPKIAWVGLVMAAAFALVAGGALAEAYIPMSTPAIGFGAGLPASDTPSTPSLDVHTPSVTVPGPCSFTFCREPTQLPGGTIATPGFESQPAGTPPVAVEHTCAPADFACLNGFTLPAQEVATAPAIPANEVGLPDSALPAACDASTGLCEGSYTFEGTGIVMPASGGEPFAPAVGFWLDVPAIEGSVPVGAPEVGTLQPIPLTIPAPVAGPVSLTLCESACPGPAGAAPIAFVGTAGLDVFVGDETVSLAPL